MGRQIFQPTFEEADLISNITNECSTLMCKCIATGNVLKRSQYEISKLETFHVEYKEYLQIICILGLSRWAVTLVTQKNFNKKQVKIIKSTQLSPHYY